MKNNRVLVVAAHPDDEVLGCGATMAKHVKSGDIVQVLILAEGLKSRNLEVGKDELIEHRDKANKANKVLGAEKVHFCDFPDNQMDTVALLTVAKEVESIIKQFQPNIVYTHNASDVNIDHRRTFDAVVVATRPQPGQTVRRILHFEVPSSTEWQLNDAKPFVPNWFVDVGETFELKIQALKCYDSEMRPWPHARSYEAIRALMSWRGATIGAKAAEAFVIGRSIE